jgi:uncharacterized protein GlcG (DUF336 family)
MEFLSLETAELIADKVIEKRKEMGFAVMTVSVLDAGGHPKILKREDDAALLRPQIAIGKAWGVLGMGFGGRELQRRAAKIPQFFNTLSDLSGGNMVPVPGGVIIRNDKGAIIGSVGVSGDTSDNDDICAIYGVESAGLIADTGD